MPLTPLFDSAALSTLTEVTSGWRMSFQSVHFLLFLPVVVAAYFLMPARLRRPWLLLASYYFYFFAAPAHLIVLLGGTLFSYLMGRAVGTAKGGGARKGLLLLGVAGLLLSLAFFKYSGLLERPLVDLFASLGIAYNPEYFVTGKALGISFTTFMALGYLIDVYRGDLPAQKNLLTHALFLGFFPAVTSGPISRAGDLMPQLADDTRSFDPAGAAGALRRMAVGFFKKMAVADTLAVLVNAVFGADLATVTGFSMIGAAVGFALQLYFDFSGYCDIALGAAALLGIKLPENFNTPYFATNFSAFWQRWHISLSSFLQDYIFTPLVWGRWTEKLPVVGKRVTKPPVLSSLAIVFLVSGLWHGDTLCYLVWGALQAAYRIGEELLHRRLGKPKKNPSFWMRTGKRAVVIVLWVESLVFFRVGMMKGGSVALALRALANQFTGFSLSSLWRGVYDAVFYGVYTHAAIVYAFLAFLAVCLAAALWGDWLQFARLGGRPVSEGIGALRRGPRWLVYYGLTLCCFAAFLLQSGGYGGANFIYGGF